MKFNSGKAQGGLFDYQERKAALCQKATPLDRLNARVDWELLRTELAGHLDYQCGVQGGRTPWGPVLMFKILVLQKYFALSEEPTGFQILDRFSFQRFLGLAVGDGVPDKNSIWTFKERLGGKGLRGCFDLFDAVRRETGLLASQGKIVDASFVEVPRHRNPREENAQIKAGRTPEGWQETPDPWAQKDVAARWAIKNQERHYGDKNHIQCNAQSKLIERYPVTDASVPDRQPLVALLDPKDGRLPADSAYRSRKIDAELRRRGSQNCLQEKGQRNHPLSESQQAANTRKSKIRVRVEHRFGFQVQPMRANWIRTIGKIRAERGLGLGHLVDNLFRYVQLGGSMV
jgi:IS5 family transposase